MKKYPRIDGYYKKPDPDMDGKDNYGKPCVVCMMNTRGQKWLRVSYMRGEDETLYVCARHWKTPDNELLNAIQESHS